MTITAIIEANQTLYGHGITPAEAAIIADLLTHSSLDRQPSDFAILAPLVDDDRLDEADDLLGRARDIRNI